VSQVTIKACTPMFIAALFTIAKLWKQPRCPTTDKWIKKMWYLFTVEFFTQPQRTRCPTTDKWIKKCGIYSQWNFTQPQRRMKFCLSQVNGWNWRTSS
jgi:hypothetical protein